MVRTEVPGHTGLRFQTHRRLLLDYSGKLSVANIFLLINADMLILLKDGGEGTVLRWDLSL